LIVLEIKIAIPRTNETSYDEVYLYRIALHTNNNILTVNSSGECSD